MHEQKQRLGFHDQHDRLVVLVVAGLGTDHEPVAADGDLVVAVSNLETAAADAHVLESGRRVVKASGNKEWDEAVLRALDRTEVLPRDTDGRVPSPMIIDFTP